MAEIFSTPVDEQISAPAAFSTPEHEKLAPAFATPPDEAASAASVSQLEAKTPEELGTLPRGQFDPIAIYNENKASLTPAQVDKLARAHRAQIEAPLNVPKVVEAAKAPVEVARSLARGAYQLAAHIPETLHLAKAGLTGNAENLTPEDIKAGQELTAAGETISQNAGTLVRGTARSVPNLVRNIANVPRDVASGIELSSLRGEINDVVQKLKTLSATENPDLHSPEYESLLNTYDTLSKRAAGLKGNLKADLTPLSADITTPSTFFQPVDWNQRFFADAAQAEQTAKVASGQGAIMGDLIQAAADQYGVTPDPKVVADMAAAGDPVNLVMGLQGLKIFSAAGGLTRVVTQGGETLATAATKEAAENFIKTVGGAVSKVGNRLR